MKTIVLKWPIGGRPHWDFVAKDASDNIWLFDKKPKLDREGWNDGFYPDDGIVYCPCYRSTVEKMEYSCSGLEELCNENPMAWDQAYKKITEVFESLPWELSLHQIKWRGNKMGPTSEEFDAVREMINNLSDEEIKERAGRWRGRLPGALGAYERHWVSERMKDIEFREYLIRKEEYEKNPMSRIYGPNPIPWSSDEPGPRRI